MENNHTPPRKPGPGMPAPGTKAKDFKGTWGKLLRYCRKYWAGMILAVIAAVGGTVLTLLGPDKLSELTKEITDGILTGIDMDAVARIGFTLVAFYLFSWLLSLLQQLIMSETTQRVSKRLRSDISHKINRLPMWYYNTTSTGDILSRVTNDVDTVAQSLQQSTGTLVSSVTLFLGSLLMMLTTDVTLTITAVAATLIGFVLMGLIMGRSQKYFARQQKALGDVNGYVEEMYTGHTVIKAYNAEENAKHTFHELNETLHRNGFKAMCLSGMMQPLMGFIGNFGYVSVCVVGALLTMDGRIGFEVIVAFMMYVRYFTQPLSQMAQAMQSLQQAAAAGERVFAFLEAEEMADESNKKRRYVQTKGRVEFDHVRFGYENSDQVVIKDFSAVAKPGQKIAIVGPTGAGKTTLVNLLMRFHEVQSGEIRIDGVPISEMTRDYVHSQFCMVLQDTWLFEGTIRENIAYGNGAATDETVTNACKFVGLDRYIRSLKDGYDTKITATFSLSAGQRQLMTIARAMVSDKPLLILDEATSSVDTRTERIVQQAMEQLTTERTSFTIAHRLSTIRDADVILVMKDGDIIEQGTHNDLIAKQGFYFELWNSQFVNAEAI